MRDYGSSSYWDERYAAQDGSNFDWYQDFGTLRPHLMPYLNGHSGFEILIPGSGNSRNFRQNVGDLQKHSSIYSRTRPRGRSL